ncbi:MAG: hypothetical protein HC848_07725 [Limnobacter sp.]|nr:hypothetical protein [Limnobacter sp.]
MAKDFSAANIVQSLADVNPETRQVHLKVVYDSGPAYTFGELQISGLEKYPEDLVKKYSPIQPGQPYEQERLLQLLSTLQNTVYFSAVEVDMQPNPPSPIEVPVLVKVSESKAKRIGLGAGYSSDTGFRSEATFFTTICSTRPIR